MLFQFRIKGIKFAYSKINSDDTAYSISLPLSDNSDVYLIPQWEFFKFYK